MSRNASSTALQTQLRYLSPLFLPQNAFSRVRKIALSVIFPFLLSFSVNVSSLHEHTDVYRPKGGWNVLYGSIRPATCQLKSLETR